MSGNDAASAVEAFIDFACILGESASWLSKELGMVKDELAVERGLRAVLDHIEGSGHACCECSDNTIWDGPISGLVEIFQKAAAKE